MSAGPAILDPETIHARIARAAARAQRSDDDLNPDVTPLAGPPKPAAVLVPIVLHERGPTVLLTQRTAHLADHAGQVSFPGGRIEPHDTDEIAAALRETQEEVGIAPEAVRVVGRLDEYRTRTGFAVTPVVGLITPPLTTRPDPSEVAEVFEAPLDFLLDRRNHQRHARVLAGHKRYFYAMPYDRFYIWGATAGMLVNLADVLGAVED